MSSSTVPLFRDWTELLFNYERSRPSEDSGDAIGRELLSFLISTDCEIPVFDSSAPRNAFSNMIMTDAELFHFYTVSPEANRSHLRTCPCDILQHLQNSVTPNPRSSPAPLHRPAGP